MGWRDGSALAAPGPGFSSQHPCGSLQSSITRIKKNKAKTTLEKLSQDPLLVTSDPKSQITTSYLESVRKLGQKPGLRPVPLTHGKSTWTVCPMMHRQRLSWSLSQHALGVRWLQLVGA